MNKKYETYLGLGIAGNFVLHLKQAGELENFKDIKVDDDAPKGLFPFYIPKADTFLDIYPFSSNTIQLPDAQTNVQAEPEVAFTCKLTYSNNKIDTITPTHFTAFNDVSLRKDASKISLKKNWGENSKGVSDTLIQIDNFSDDTVMQNYRISSFLRRDSNVFRYGEDAPFSGYSYFGEKLLSWIKNQINSQIDIGPLENISNYIKKANNPENLIITIGSTRYTKYGETTYLQKDDEVIVALYDSRHYCKNDILSKVVAGNYEDKNISMLAQRVTL